MGWLNNMDVNELIRKIQLIKLDIQYSEYKIQQILNELCEEQRRKEDDLK